MRISVNAEFKDFQKSIIKACTEVPPVGEVFTTVVTAARQIGKSWTLRLLCLLWVSNPNTFVCYVTTSQRLAGKFLREFKRILSGVKGVEFNGSDLRINFPNGSEIDFFSAESADRLRGNTYDYVVVDECAFIREQDSSGQNFFYDILSPTLDAGGKHLVLVSTPHGTQNYFYEQYQKAKADGRLIEVPVTADGTKTKEWLERKRSSIPESTWRQEYMVEFLSAGYSFFSDDYSDKFIRDGNINNVDGVYIGVDPSVGGGDGCGVVAIGQVLEQLHVDCYNLTLDHQDKDAMAKKVADVVKSYGDKVKGILVEDVSPKGFYQDIKRYLPPHIAQRVSTFVTTNQSKYSICTSLNSTLQFMRFRREDSNSLRVQLDNFVVLKQVGTSTVLGNSSPKIHDDLVIALALAYESYSRGKKKGNFGIKFG